jgi:hypothetical protein
MLPMTTFPEVGEIWLYHGFDMDTERYFLVLQDRGPSQHYLKSAHTRDLKSAHTRVYFCYDYLNRDNREVEIGLYINQFKKVA